ncbi:hypothetical protein FDK38_004106 [Candidozyma auris]|nr:hypothetical protein FDK38_004106 [[Candida] auris]
MTVDNRDDAFTGLMKSLNIDVNDYNHAELARLDYPRLAQVKEEVELQLTSLFDTLKHRCNCDMDSPLVVDGFPRSDVDVVTVRLVRTKIIRLRNDHKCILGLLEKHLTRQLRSGDGNALTETRAEEAAPRVTYNIPFALVKSVAASSPAEKSGLRENDKILVFGDDVHAGNHDKLQAVGNKVKGNVGREIRVSVLRGQHRHTLVLVPTPDWPGQGLLGCHIVPY